MVFHAQLDKFYALCQDELWGVRKACAEVFMSLSRVVSPSKRRNDLGSLFVNLLQDESRWVRMAAFQALGPFISTFSKEDGADGLTDGKDGDSSSCSSRNECSPSEAASSEKEGGAMSGEAESDFNDFHYWRDPLPEVALEMEILPAGSSNPSSVSESVEKALEDLMARVELSGEASSAPQQASSPSTEATEVHAFDLRRVACQELLAATANAAAPADPNPNTTDMETEATTTSAAISTTEPVNDLSGDSDNSMDNESSMSSENEDADNAESSPTATNQTNTSAAAPFQPNLLMPPAYVRNPSSTTTGGDLPTTVYSNSFYSYYPSHRRRLSDGGLGGANISMEAPVRPRPYSPLQPGHQRSGSGSMAHQQHQMIVPPNLMEYYLQMTDPYYVETVDAEITRHCAYSLPAVVCTLGKEHWPLLRDLYTTLASDMQWKVRRTLASSIHEIGAILGQDVVTADLLPVFDGFAKDLDEVRIGILKHLADFLRLLPDKERRNYLPRLADFLKLDNEQNWRFRQELATQLHSVVALFSPSDSAQFILPLALTLASDRVAAVRLPAFTLVSSHLSIHLPSYRLRR